jgi:hypothetical protein
LIIARVFYQVAQNHMVVFFYGRPEVCSEFGYFVVKLLHRHFEVISSRICLVQFN